MERKSHSTFKSQTRVSVQVSVLQGLDLPRLNLPPLDLSPQDLEELDLSTLNIPPLDLSPLNLPPLDLSPPHLEELDLDKLDLGWKPKHAQPKQPTSQEFDEPWRKMKWNQKKLLEEKLRNFKVKNPDVDQVRILLVGPIGAGKSSYINSVNNAFQGRITCEALVATGTEKSFTKKYQTHYIEGEDGNPLAFIFNDIMGLEAEDGCGAHERDLIKALEGCVEEGYKFNPASYLSSNDPDYRHNPELNHQIFCLVNVLPADKVSLMNNKLFQKIRRIQNRATELEIPQVIIMTKSDKACPLVQKDLRKIYTSKKIKEKMETCSNMLGVPMNHIFPVKNYHEEMDTDDDIDSLILKALDQIVHIGNDALKKAKSLPSKE